MLGQGREGDVFGRTDAQGAGRNHLDALPRQVILLTGFLSLGDKGCAVGLKEANTTDKLHCLKTLSNRNEEVIWDVTYRHKRNIFWMVFFNVLWLHAWGDGVNGRAPTS